MSRSRQTPPSAKRFAEDSMKGLFSLLTVPQNHPTHSGQSGLTRLEFLWVLGLCIIALVTILWTLQLEQQRAQTRHAIDGLEHLRGMIELSEVPLQSSQIWAGKGTLPQSFPEHHPLEDFLGVSSWTGPDPWGGAFILQQVQGAWFIMSFGPDHLGDKEDLALPITR